MGCGFEVEIAEAIALPSPAQRAAAEHAHTNPGERLFLRAWVLPVIHKPLVVVFRTRRTGTLDGPSLRHKWGMPKVRQLPGRFVFGKFTRLNAASRFQQGHAHSCFGEALGSPTACCA